MFNFYHLITSKYSDIGTISQLWSPKKPLGANAFKILFISRYRHVLMFIQLFKSFLEVALQNHLNFHCILEVTAFQPALYPLKEIQITLYKIRRVELVGKHHSAMLNALLLHKH
jgi:hypothetical protein